MNLYIAQKLMLLIVIIIAITFHEFAHGFVSHLQGDEVPEKNGRLTLNPASHIDLFGLIAVFLFQFGWGKPIPVSYKNYRHKRLGIILTSAAGPMANLILVMAGTIVYNSFNFQNIIVQFFWLNLILINASLAILNLIPIPPLDGSKIIAELIGGRLREWIYRLEGRGTIILILLIWFPVTSNLLFGLSAYVANLPSQLLFHITLF